MNPQLENETKKLTASWMRHESDMLRDYLVADVEDPRTNIQSILTRHFLIESLFGKNFADLMKEELTFAVVLNWMRQLTKEKATEEDFHSILYALEKRADNAEGIKIPRYISEAFRVIPVETSRALQQRKNSSDAFQILWQSALADENPKKISVLEPACGSANDYRFFESYGLARLLDYQGFDLCEKNVANARAMFPAARFEVGNVFAIPAPDKAFDYCVVQDLFEHLSLEGMERAVNELCRVTREGICAGFFSLHEGRDHLVREVDDYHWNTLGLDKMAKLFVNHGFTIQVIHIETFLRWKFGCDFTHNRNAYTLLLRK